MPLLQHPSQLQTQSASHYQHETPGMHVLVTGETHFDGSCAAARTKLLNMVGTVLQAPDFDVPSQDSSCPQILPEVQTVCCTFASCLTHTHMQCRGVEQCALQVSWPGPIGPFLWLWWMRTCELKPKPMPSGTPCDAHLNQCCRCCCCTADANFVASKPCHIMCAATRTYSKTVATAKPDCCSGNQSEKDPRVIALFAEHRVAILQHTAENC